MIEGCRTAVFFGCEQHRFKPYAVTALGGGIIVSALTTYFTVKIIFSYYVKVALGIVRLYRK